MTAKKEISHKGTKIQTEGTKKHFVPWLLIFVPLCKTSSSVVRIFGERQAEIAIVQMDHQVFSDNLHEGCVEPRCVVELRRDIFTTASVGAVFIKVRVQIRIGR